MEEPNSKLEYLLCEVKKVMDPFKVYAVGGCCRDYIMGNRPKDYDFCTDASPDQIEECVRRANRKPFLVGKRFGTVGCKIQLEDGTWEQIEITTFRTEQYQPGNRKPEVEFATNITQDLSRRDFTINSIAIRLDKGRLRIIDPFNGMEDIKNKKIRAVGSAKQRFHEDPLRILRAIRFATRFKFSIEEKTFEKLCHCVPHLLEISKERWVMELDKILLDDNVGVGLKYLWETKIFNWIIPEMSLQYNHNQNSMYHSFTLDEHTARVVSACPKDIDLRWAALLHDIAKPFVRTEKEIKDGSPEHIGLIKCNYISHELLGAEMARRIAQHLKFSNERTEKVVDLISRHLEDSCELRKYDNLAKHKDL